MAPVGLHFFYVITHICVNRIEAVNDFEDKIEYINCVYTHEYIFIYLKLKSFFPLTEEYENKFIFVYF